MPASRSGGEVESAGGSSPCGRGGLSWNNEIKDEGGEAAALSSGSTEQGDLPANARRRYAGSGCALGNPSSGRSGEHRDPSLGEHRTSCVGGDVVEECFHSRDALVAAHGSGRYPYGICSSEEVL